MKRLVELRKQKGFSQTKLGEMINVSQQSIYKYENGIAEPDIHTLKQLASIFEVTIDHLVGFDETYENQTNEIQTTEYRHLILYRLLPDEVKLTIDDMIIHYIKK